MIVHIKDIIKNAQKGGYAVGAFNIHNIESVLGVAQAALRANSPVIIQVSENVVEYMGIKPITHIVSTVAKNVAAKVPIALHLDHGRNFNSISECINSGFSSVQIDASDLQLDENIKLTQNVAAVAHAKGVWVQGEVGAIKGGHGRVKGKIMEAIPLANIEDVVKFVKETKVDAIAAAVGTVHGAFKNEDINFGLLRDIIKKTKLPFVLHGGSGVDDKKIKRAIREGVCVINIGTDIKVAFSHTLIKSCLVNSRESDPRVLLRPTIKAVEEVAYNKMKLFNSINRASVKRVEI